VLGQDGKPTNQNRTTCVTSDTFAVEGKLMSTTSLPPYSIEDPLPVPDGCTASSIINPRWVLSHFTIDNTTATSPAISFNIILQTANQGFQYPILIEQGKASSDGWYECDIGQGGDTGQLLFPTKCSFKYAPETKQLALKADWLCSDLDHGHP